MSNKQKSKRTKRVKKSKSESTPLQPTLPIWDNRSEWMRHGICLLLLVIVSFTLFAPIHFKNKTLFAFDTVSFKAMANEMILFEEETGEKGLWSPNPFGGMPGYMISTPLEVKQADDIPRWLRQFIWPSSHFLFLLVGMYWLGYYLTKNNWAAVLASIAYGMTTYVPIILMAGHNSKFIAMGFSPWLILAFVYVLRRPGLLASLLFAAALAVNLRAGHVQITYYVAFMLGVWWVVEGVVSARENKLKPFLMATLWLGLGSVLALLMVAQPYLSNFEYKAYTIRGAGPGGVESGLSWDYAMRWSQGVGELLTLLISDAYGGASAYWGPKPPTGGPHYVGGIILVLAVFAAIAVKRREVVALAIAAVIMTLFSFGRHFEGLNRLMYEYFPFFDSFRVPETWLSIVALALALLAAFGLTYAFRVDDTKQSTPSTFHTLLKVAIAGASVVLLLLVAKNGVFSFERAGEVDQIMQQVARQNNVPLNNPQVASVAEQAVERLREDRIERFTNDAVRSFLFILGIGVIFFLFQRRRLPVVVASVIVVLLIGIDLGGVWTRYFTEERLGTGQTEDALVPEYGFDTYLIAKKNELGGNGHFRVLSFEGSPTEIARPAYHYETLSGYHGAKLRLYQDYIENILYDASGLPNENALDLMNTRYVVAGVPYPGAQEVFKDEATGFIVSERINTPPRANFVGAIERIPEAEDTWNRIKDPAFNPATTAIIHSEGELVTTPIDSTSLATATLEMHSPHEIKWTVETNAPRLLVISEIYYPAGWKAMLNGTEVPIHRVNYLLRGVSIPEGSHELVMVFSPQSYKIGHQLTLFSTLLVYGGIVLLLGLSFVRRKRDEEVSVAS